MRRMLSKGLTFAVMLLFLGMLVESSISGEAPDNTPPTSGVIDITVVEAWALLSNISNGVQIPIDVRTEGEWRNERIDTPYPEFPRHHNLYDLQENETKLQRFMSLYDGEEIILYCRSGGRSAVAGNLLVNSGFNGTIYNMLGGINAWKNNGLPTKVGNMPPNQPDPPIGPTMGVVNTLLTYHCTGNDPDDDIVRYGWDWDGDKEVDEWTNYYPSETTIDTSHAWTTPGVYNVQVMVEDLVGDNSSFSPPLSILVTPETPPFDIEITEPEKAFYINNHKMFPFPVPFVIGSIYIRVEILQGEVEKVEFYVDSNLKKTVYNEPYSWTWVEKTFGKHVVKAVAYDASENQDSDEITVWKFF
ncbi:MAG TPA: PKD domain-containing protein [Thermoplasmatales archaeon]|nr:PKD domain-containing protein [Thermoplasmatales archaeon]